MSVLKAVVVCLALLLAAETTTDAQVTKYDTSKGSFRSDDDANTSKSSEERAIPVPVFEKNLSFLDEISVIYWQWRKRPAEKVFRGLKLAKNVPRLFDNPKFYKWLAYSPPPILKVKDWWIPILMENTKPDALTTAVFAGMKSEHEYARNLAHYLQHRRYEIVHKDNAPLSVVFKNLGLDKGDLLSTPAFKHWREYYKARFKATDDTLVKVMQPALQKIVDSPADLINGLVVAATTDKDAQIRVFAEKLIHKIWREEEVKPIHLVEELGLEEDEFLFNPALPIWTSYCRTVPGFKKGSIASTLDTFHGRQFLMEALVHGKEDPSTSVIATSLFNDMVDYYSALNPKERIQYIFADDEMIRILGTLSSPRYMVWKEAAPKSTTISEEELFVNELRTAFDKAQILTFIILSIGKAPAPEGFAKKVERYFLAQFTHGNDEKYEAFKRMVWATTPFDERYGKRIVAEREAWLKSSHAKIV